MLIDSASRQIHRIITFVLCRRKNPLSCCRRRPNSVLQNNYKNPSAPNKVNRRIAMMIPRSILFCFALIFGNVTSFVRGFSTLKRFCALPRQQHSYEHHRQSFPRLRELAVDFVENSDFDDEIIGDESGSVIDDLNWRVEKLRLEEENTKRFLKSGPRFLPYEECRNWVQAWGHRWKSKEDW